MYTPGTNIIKRFYRTIFNHLVWGFSLILRAPPPLGSDFAISYTKMQIWGIFESSIVEGDEESYLANFQTHLVTILHKLSLLFWHFITSTANHLGRYLTLAVTLPQFVASDTFVGKKGSVHLILYRKWSCTIRYFDLGQKQFYNVGPSSPPKLFIPTVCILQAAVWVYHVVYSSKFGSRHSVTRLADFGNYLVTNLITKVAQNVWWLFGQFWKPSL